MQKNMKAWVCVDQHKVGTWRQAEALASLWLKEYDKKPIQLPIWGRWMPPTIFNVLPDFLKALFVRGLGNSVPKIIVAAGRQAVLVALALRNKTKTVVLMNPGVSSKYFDVVIAPAHDMVNGKNVITTLGALHSIQLDNLSYPQYLKKYKKPHIAVLLGGNSVHGDYQENMAIQMANDLKKLLKICSDSSSKNASLIITPSRRTPEKWLNIFKKNLCGVSYWIWDQQSENPYPGLLKGADAVIVCEDSISMASESCITGKPVWVYPTGIKKKKFKYFYQQLFINDYARPFSFELDFSEKPILNELDQVVKELKFILKEENNLIG